MAPNWSSVVSRPGALIDSWKVVSVGAGDRSEAAEWARRFGVAGRVEHPALPRVPRFVPDPGAAMAPPRAFLHVGVKFFRATRDAVNPAQRTPCGRPFRAPHSFLKKGLTILHVSAYHLGPCHIW